MFYKNTVLIYDEDVITPMKSKAKQLGFPILATAEAMGNVTSANILSLGIILGETGLMDVECLRKAIWKRFAGKPTVAEKNEAILARGLEMATQAC